MENKLVLSVILACGLAAFAQSAEPVGTVLETSTNTRTGNTSRLLVGPGSFQQLEDGSTLVTTAPLLVVTDADGVEIKRVRGGPDIVVKLSPAQSAGISQLFVAAYQAQLAEAAAKKAAEEAAKAAAANPPTP